MLLRKFLALILVGEYGVLFFLTVFAFRSFFLECPYYPGRNLGLADFDLLLYLGNCSLFPYPAEMTSVEVDSRTLTFDKPLPFKFSNSEEAL